MAKVFLASKDRLINGSRFFYIHHSPSYSPPDDDSKMLKDMPMETIIYLTSFLMIFIGPSQLVGADDTRSISAPEEFAPAFASNVVAAICEYILAWLAYLRMDLLQRPSWRQIDRTSHSSTTLQMYSNWSKVNKNRSPSLIIYPHDTFRSNQRRACRFDF